MKRVLALQHAWECPTGTLGEILQEHAIACDTVDVAEESLPDLGRYDAIIALGGPQHVYEEEKHPYFVAEKALIQTSIEQAIPFLGICLGGQLLAETLGSTVKQHTMTEIGFFDIPLTEAGQKDPLFAGLPGYQKVFHWHEDTFDIPADSILLATSATTQNQVFRYGHNAYALQYHIELNSDLFDLWLHYPEFKQSIIDSVGIDTYININQERNTYYQTYRAHTRLLFENFLRIVRIL